MSIKDMHYDFKVRLNKIDSNQYRNIKIPEIDRKLNEAALIIVKSITRPRRSINSVLQYNQRSMEDIRTLIVDASPLTITQLDVKTFSVTLPENYFSYIKSEILASKGDCKNIKLEDIVRRHEDKYEEVYDISSFEWRECNLNFTGNTIKMFTDTTFSIDSFKLDYIRQFAYMHNAEDFLSTGYALPNGTVLTGFQDCELPEVLHTEIVDLAVLIASGEINALDYQIKLNKFQINQ